MSVVCRTRFCVPRERFYAMFAVHAAHVHDSDDAHVLPDETLFCLLFAAAEERAALAPRLLRPLLLSLSSWSLPSRSNPRRFDIISFIYQSAI